MAFKLRFKTARGYKRFQIGALVVAGSIYFSRQIWDFILQPLYLTYYDIRGMHSFFAFCD